MIRPLMTLSVSQPLPGSVYYLVFITFTSNSKCCCWLYEPLIGYVISKLLEWPWLGWMINQTKAASDVEWSHVHYIMCAYCFSVLGDFFREHGSMVIYYNDNMNSHVVYASVVVWKDFGKVLIFVFCWSHFSHRGQWVNWVLAIPDVILHFM